MFHLWLVCVVSVCLRLYKQCGYFVGLIPVSFQPVYSASKFGVLAYSLALKVLFGNQNRKHLIMQEAAEANGVRINCICPWTCDTPMVRNAVKVNYPDETIREEVIKIAVK